MKTVLITGANRGLGLEFAKQYSAAGYQVYATTRTPLADDGLKALSDKHKNVNVLSFEATDEKQIAGLKTMLSGHAIDILIANAGYYGPKDERNALGQVDTAEWLKTFNINVLAPLKLVEALVDNIKLGKDKKIAILSSKMGSMGDNGSGGSYIYRSSKAAINAVVKSLSIDLAPHKIKLVALHPGWVKTDMGGSNALIDTQTSIAGMKTVIQKLTHKQSGSFIAYDGQNIPW